MPTATVTELAPVRPGTRFSDEAVGLVTPDGKTVTKLLLVVEVDVTFSTTDDTPFAADRHDR